MLPFRVYRPSREPISNCADHNIGDGVTKAAADDVLADPYAIAMEAARLAPPKAEGRRAARNAVRLYSVHLAMGRSGALLNVSRVSHANKL